MQLSEKAKKSCENNAKYGLIRFEIIKLRGD